MAWCVFQQQRRASRSSKRKRKEEKASPDQALQDLIGSVNREKKATARNPMGKPGQYGDRAGEPSRAAHAARQSSLFAWDR